MIQAELSLSDRRVKAAVSEITGSILDHFPSAVLETEIGDDPHAVYITVTVDIDGTDDVIDQVIDRLIEINVDEGIPLHVIAVAPPERQQAALTEALIRYGLKERPHSAAG